MISRCENPIAMKHTAVMASYASFHDRRFHYFLDRVTSVLPRNSCVMDLGCHFLDQAILLVNAGYKVHGLDVEAFVEIERVKNIAAMHNIKLSTVHNLSDGNFGGDIPDSSFDALVLTEILEHLAFNPLPMWKSLFRVLKPGALIFLTTPNGMSLRRRLREMVRVALGLGKGVSIKELFGTVTYGHHWKEYGIKELFEYFERIGIPRRNIEVQRYNYQKLSEWWRLSKLTWLLLLLAKILPGCEEDLFVIVRLPAEKPIVPDPPSYS